MARKKVSNKRISAKIYDEDENEDYRDDEDEEVEDDFEDEEEEKPKKASKNKQSEITLSEYLDIIQGNIDRVQMNISNLRRILKA